MSLIAVAAIGGFVLLVILISLMFRTVVSTNAVHIVQSSKQRTSYGGVDAQGQPRRNTYYAWPSWIPFIGVKVSTLPLSVFDLPLDGYNAYDKGRLPFVIDMMAFFRINDSGMAAERVHSFEELKEQLESILKGAARTILATSQIEEIMESRAVFGEKFTAEVEHQLVQWGVTPVKNIELMDLRDAQGSQVIANIMAKKKSEIEKDSRVAVAINTQAAQTAEIEAKREVAIREQEAAETVGIRTASQTQKVGISRQQAEQAIAEEAAKTAEKSMAVNRVQSVRQAEINREVQVVAADQSRQTSIISADAAKQTAVTRAEGDKAQAILVAEGQMESMKRHAEGIEAEGRATGAAETAKNLASVTPQITLAKEIGENQGYQSYLVSIKQVEANRDIGVAQAGALTKADVRIIVQGGTIQEGAKSVLDLLTPRGAQQLGAAIESAMNASDTVAAVVEGAAAKLTNKQPPKVNGTGVAR
jgi:flotillin